VSIFPSLENAKKEAESAQRLGALHCGLVQSLLIFFALTYAVTWTCFFTAVALPSSVRMPLLLLGTVAPSLVALGITAQNEGLPGIQALLRRMLDARVAWRQDGQGVVIATYQSREHADAAHPLGLLRACLERHCCSGAKHHDEVAPPHVRPPDKTPIGTS
jgi:hypothetical protein